MLKYSRINVYYKGGTGISPGYYMKSCKRLGIDIGSTTVKVAIIDDDNRILFADWVMHKMSYVHS